MHTPTVNVVLAFIHLKKLYIYSYIYFNNVCFWNMQLKYAQSYSFWHQNLTKWLNLASEYHSRASSIVLNPSWKNDCRFSPYLCKSWRVLSWNPRTYFNEYETINKDMSAGHNPLCFSMNFPQCALRQGTKPLAAPPWEHARSQRLLQNHGVWIHKPQPAPATTHPNCCKFLWALCYNS